MLTYLPVGQGCFESYPAGDIYAAHYYKRFFRCANILEAQAPGKVAREGMVGVQTDWSAQRAAYCHSLGSPRCYRSVTC